MDYILELLLTGWIDPFLWIKSMSTLGVRENKRKCLGAFFLCYLLVVGKGYTATRVKMGAISTLFTITLAAYLFLATIFLFGGEVQEKVLYAGIFFCILFASELIVIGVCVVCKLGSWDNIMSNGGMNLACSGVAKILQAILCYGVFNRKKDRKRFYCDYEVTSLVSVICILVASIIIRAISDQQGYNVILLIGISIILSLWYIISSFSELKKKDKNIMELNQELSYSLERKDLAQDIKYFKYNFSTNVFIMKNLCYYKEYEKFGIYMNRVFEDVERAELLFDHPNITIRILMSGLIQTAKKMGIPLSARIQVREFQMDDEDICSILKNLVMNGLEAAAKVPHEIAHVSLQVLYTDTGYEIRCINDCFGTVSFDKTTKQDKKNHGYGVGIVNKIVKKYHGTIDRVYTKTKRTEIGIVAVTIRIHCNRIKKE